MTSIAGINSQDWQVEFLPLPKRYSRGVALGFCDGRAVGCVEPANGTAVGCWWGHGGPELLAVPGYKVAVVDAANGSLIAGRGRKPASDGAAAALWLPAGEALECVVLHEKGFEKSWTTGCGGGVVTGVGILRGKPATRGPDVGLVWREPKGAPVTLRASAEVSFVVTDGARFAGCVDGHPALWQAIDGAVVDLLPEGMYSGEVRAVDGEIEAGVVFKGMFPRPALWRGSAASFVDLTPSDHMAGQVNGSAGGFQVGYARRTGLTGNGSTAMDDHAVLWQGAPARMGDLNALLPEPYNASTAHGIEIADGEIRICGEACRVESSGAANAVRAQVVRHPVLWTAPLIS